ncbi:protein of unknown function DUF29 [Thioflavicoccus mobilis 8321]|uniref:DUF29 domain-containing protein n=1 Tax=Thioflavicoccus mobilis 8321 TaxID=765912 RepID=L0GUF7_9GAMM|nr:DUF29 domain-containing protein [Thioflavicoccus mobilis]AGA89447.1 protein of unknown function DUF29 [Thioflavicoccus mobilis 8321]
MSSYEQDFYRWTQEQANLLRQGRLSAIDVDHLIEELETLGARERRELTYRLKVLLAHLLKWRYQPKGRSRSWRATIDEQRLSLDDLLDDNPSLRSTLDEQLAKAHRLGRLLAIKETDLDEDIFPGSCPFALADVLAKDRYPGE